MLITFKTNDKIIINDNFIVNFVSANVEFKEIIYENKEIKDFILSGVAESRPYSKWRSNHQLRLDIDKVMRILSTVESCSELTLYKALHYEQLKYDRSGQSSVRLGFKTKFRLIFTELDNGIIINIIEISEHYGDK